MWGGFLSAYWHGKNWSVFCSLKMRFSGFIFCSWRIPGCRIVIFLLLLHEGREVRPRPRGQLATLVSDTDREDGIEKEGAKLIFPFPLPPRLHLGPTQKLEVGRRGKSQPLFFPCRRRRKSWHQSQDNFWGEGGDGMVTANRQILFQLFQTVCRKGGNKAMMISRHFFGGK